MPPLVTLVAWPAALEGVGSRTIDMSMWFSPSPTRSLVGGEGENMLGFSPKIDRSQFAHAATSFRASATYSAPNRPRDAARPIAETSRRGPAATSDS